MASPSHPSRPPRALPPLVRPVLALPLLALLALLPACSTSGEVLTVYSGRTEELVGPILEDFASETGIDIEVRYGQSADLALLIAEEGDASPADVFISQSPGPVGFLDQRDLLGTIDPEVLDLVPEEVRAEDGSWVGLSGRKRVLVYNTELVEPADLPDSVLDLTDSAYEGQVGLAPANGSFQDFVTTMRAELGDEATLEWLSGMADNGARSYENNNAIVEAVGRGEIPMGLVNHYYNYRVLDENPQAVSANHEFPAEDLGSTLIVTTGAVLASSDQTEQADELLAFLLGEEAQTFFAEETFEYPLAAGVEPPEILPPFELVRVEGIDLEALGGDLEGTVELINESGLSG